MTVEKKGNTCDYKSVVKVMEIIQGTLDPFVSFLIFLFLQYDSCLMFVVKLEVTVGL